MTETNWELIDTLEDIIRSLFTFREFDQDMFEPIYDTGNIIGYEFPIHTLRGSFVLALRRK